MIQRNSRKLRKYPSANAEFIRQAARETAQESLFLPNSLSEKIDLRVKPDFHTACWSYQPPHKIFVGSDIYENEHVREGLTPEQLAEYTGLYVHHEMAHGLYTERDLSKVKKALASFSAPFSIFNLFEDSRIEHRYARETGFRFQWTKFEKVSAPESPLALFFNFIQQAGNKKAVKDLFASVIETWTGPVQDESQRWSTFEKVWAYYERCTQCPDSHAVVLVVKAWVQEFGQSSENQGVGDLPYSLALQNPQEMADFEQGTISCTESANAGGNPGGSAGGEGSGSVQANSTSHELTEGSGRPLHAERIAKLVQKMQRLLAPLHRTIRSDMPGKKVSARHYALGRKPFERADQAKAKIKKLYIQVDCSSSMSGFHIEEGILLVAALSDLAKAGRVKGDVVFSAVIAGKNCWKRYSLPMSQDALSKVNACGEAEGLEPALKANLQLAKEADLVLVYTDGNICDRPINKSQLHTQGVFTWGVYVGEQDRCLDDLNRYFDKALVRKTVEELVDAMLLQM